MSDKKLNARLRASMTRKEWADYCKKGRADNPALRPHGGIHKSAKDYDSTTRRKNKAQLKRLCY